MKKIVLIAIILFSFSSFSQIMEPDEISSSCEKSQQTLRATRVYLQDNLFQCVAWIPERKIRNLEVKSRELLDNLEISDECKYQMNSRNLHSDKRPGHGYEVVVTDRNKKTIETKYKLIVEESKQDLHSIIITHYTLTIGDVFKSGDFLDPQVEEDVIKKLYSKIVCERIKSE